MLEESHGALTPVLLYDGSCGLCASIVQFVLRHDRQGTLRFAGLDSRFADDIRARHPALHAVDSVIWVEPAWGSRSERVFLHSDAALALARYLGGWWRLALAGRLIPRPLRDGLYEAVARHRHQIPEIGASCVLSTADTRHRFLE